MKRVLVFGDARFARATPDDDQRRRERIEFEVLNIHRVLGLLVQPADLMVCDNSDGAAHRARQWAAKSDVDVVMYSVNPEIFGMFTRAVCDEELIEARPDVAIGFGGTHRVDWLKRLDLAGIPVVLVR